VFCNQGGAMFQLHKSVAIASQGSQASATTTTARSAFLKSTFLPNHQKLLAYRKIILNTKEFVLMNVVPSMTPWAWEGKSTDTNSFVRL